MIITVAVDKGKMMDRLLGMFTDPFVTLPSTKPLSEPLNVYSFSL